MSKAQASYLLKDLQNPKRDTSDNKAAKKAKILKRAMASDSD